MKNQQLSLMLLVLSVILSSGVSGICAQTAPSPESTGERLRLRGGRGFTVRLQNDFSLKIARADGQAVWASSSSMPPAFTVRKGAAEPKTLRLANAGSVIQAGFRSGPHRGNELRLTGFEGTDAALQFVIAIDSRTNELLVQIAPAGGSDTVVSVEHLYRFEKPVAAGGYLVLPRGSGYLVHADCPDALPGNKDPWTGNNNKLVGSGWALPMFGMVRGNDGLCIIADTWWDCEVHDGHEPGVQSTLDVNWVDSLGKLDYARRFFIRFGEKMDYAAMAKDYRAVAKRQGLLKTLKQKAKTTPVISRYAQNVLLRWTAWNPQDEPRVLHDVDRFNNMGLGVNFFYPKVASMGYSEATSAMSAADAGWQGYLQSSPVPGGWPTLAKLAEKAHAKGVPIQSMISMYTQYEGAPAYDEARWPRDAQGNISRRGLSLFDAHERIERVLDNLKAKDVAIDVLYFDGYSAKAPVPLDYSPAHPMTRRRNFEMQNAVFAETRSRGLMPGGELARFWAMADCDYFFFTDWASDRLVNKPVKGAPAPVGEPIPLFQLVFHDCYIAGFSGGGYALYTSGYDWWADRTPRLYELMFASAPAHNWLPNGPVPITDWDSPLAQNRWRWLQRWNAYYSAIATSEMVSHQFLTTDRKHQKIRFANGVNAEFDFAGNRCKVSGVPGFSGRWEEPAGDLGEYPNAP